MVAFYDGRDLLFSPYISSDPSLLSPLPPSVPFDSSGLLSADELELSDSESDSSQSSPRLLSLSSGFDESESI